MILSPSLISALSQTRASSSSVISGASSGSTHCSFAFETLEKLRFFFCMAIPHRDNVAIRATLSPSHDHHSFIQPADGEQANLAVVEAIVDKCHFTTGEYLLCVRREINP